MTLASLRFKPVFIGLMLFILLFSSMFLITACDTDDDDHDDDDHDDHDHDDHDREDDDHDDHDQDDDHDDGTK